MGQLSGHLIGSASSNELLAEIDEFVADVKLKMLVSDSSFVLIICRTKFDATRLTLPALAIELLLSDFSAQIVSTTGGSGSISATV